MSNPYAPPGDRPPAQPVEPAPADVPAQGDAGGAGRSAPGGRATGGGPAGSAGSGGVPGSGAPNHSPEGVPYERPRTAPRGPAPHPADAHRVAVLTRTTALLVLASVLAGLLPFPWYLAAVPLVLASVAAGAWTMIVAARSRVRGAPVGLVGLLLFVALIGLARPAQTALMWDIERQYAQCTDGALTVQARNGCVTQYEKAREARLEELSGRA